MRKVVAVREYWGPTGHDMAEVTLSCGHKDTVVLRRRHHRTERKPPTKLACHDCLNGKKP